MKTAVEWLVKIYLQTNKIDSFDIQQAKEMEKKQIIDAWNGGDYAYFYSKETGRDFDNGEQYYNETYVNKGSDEHIEDNIEEIPTSSQTEISDEEIKEVAYRYKENELEDTWEAGISFMDGAKWYREQIKNK